MSEFLKKEQEDLFKELCQIIAEEVDMLPEEIGLNMLLQKDLDMDSNSLMQVLIACQVEFDLDFDSVDIRDFKTVSDILSAISAIEGLDMDEEALIDE